MIVISTAFGAPTERLCRTSVLMQSHRCDHVYIDAAKQKEPKTHAENLWAVVAGLPPREIVVQLDGDDWLSSRDALAKLDEVYASGDVWLTYGSFVTSSGNRGGNCSAYAPYENVRQSPWRATHLKTFRAGLFQRVDPAHLKLPDGRWTHLSVDRACMFPMIEMAGWDRTRYIADELSVYHYEHSYENNMTPQAAKAAHDASMHFASLPRYERIRSL